MNNYTFYILLFFLFFAGAAMVIFKIFHEKKHPKYDGFILINPKGWILDLSYSEEEILFKKKVLKIKVVDCCRPDEEALKEYCEEDINSLKKLSL